MSTLASTPTLLHDSQASAPAGSLDQIHARLAPLQARLAAHPLYASIRTPQHLRLFMQSHVFAVWDFMSLLKTLQARLTCTSVPWTPTAFPDSRRFINEIVLGEESDVYAGQPISHFELYVQAMQEFGADTGPIHSLLNAIAPTGSAHSFRTPASAPEEARQFVESTFTVIRSASLPAVAAAFTFGREDAIPTLFRALVLKMNQELDHRDNNLTRFVWYLERHIEVDGEEHGPLSLRMIEDLCGTNPQLWAEAEDAAAQAIEARLTLWNGILARIQAAPPA